MTTETPAAPAEAPVSWKPQVQVAGEGDKWHDNALRFATEKEAKDYASDLFSRWTLTTGYRAAPSSDPVNYSYHDWTLTAVTAEEKAA